jgi:O-succinylhomoserine sulfhydrylase
MNALRLVDISNNLGDSKSLATHPATTTHMRVGAEERAKLGIADGTVRLSVGLEDVAGHHRGPQPGAGRGQRRPARAAE